MHLPSLPIGIFAIACGLLASAAPARAAAETWVSGTGSNAGTCPITAPCRTFQFAYGQTNGGGAINVLTSGNFGPVTITKSISIVADGVEAVINTGAGGAAIIVNAPGIAVSLRGLTIDVSGNIGISFVSGAILLVHNCVIRRAQGGISFEPASGIARLSVVDTVIANTIGSGINVRPTGSSSAKVALDGVRVENATFDGIVFSGAGTTGSINATVHDSVAAGNGRYGIYAERLFAGTTKIMIDHTASANNGNGIRADGAGATIRFGDSTVSGNGVGLFKDNGGVIVSYGTNKVNGNTVDGTPTSTIPMI